MSRQKPGHFFSIIPAPMVLRDIDRLLDSWAPKAIAWDRDNVGLQIGDPARHIRKILLALDLTDDIIREAKRKSADLVITHHPLFFRPVRSIRSDERVGRLTLSLAANNIAHYALHTNLDYAPGGVSYALAGALGLRDIGSLEPLTGTFQKIAVFVPEGHADAVMRAMTSEGAGTIGAYDHCSFQTAGTGTFRPLQNARPYIGTGGTHERVNEIRIEMVVPRWKCQQVVSAMRHAHPYEEVAYDVIDLATPVPQYGAGAIGSLPRAMTLRSFLALVKRRLGTPHLRYCGDAGRNIRTVAVCGGSGTDYLPAALRNNADVFVTADLRYHTFQDCDGNIALVDAGHYETEKVVLRQLLLFLRSRHEVRKRKMAVVASSVDTNFVHYS
jgi:dinuclear metal center YbgI/SA1388 family protein